MVFFVMLQILMRSENAKERGVGATIVQFMEAHSQDTLASYDEV